MEDNRNMLPSERSDIEAKAIARAKERADAVNAMLREDFGRTFNTEHGKRVLALLCQRSGFGKVILSADSKTGAVDPMLTTFAAMELNFYIFIRNLLPIELIQEIEDVRRIQPSGTIIEPVTGSDIQRTGSKPGRSAGRKSPRAASRRATE